MGAPPTTGDCDARHDRAEAHGRARRRVRGDARPGGGVCASGRALADRLPLRARGATDVQPYG